MEEYHEAGIRGIRINYGNDGSDAEIASDFLKAAAIARRKDWVVELWVPIRAFQTLHSIIPTQGVRVVADHYAHAQVASRTGNPRDTIDPFGIPGFSEVIDLIKNHNLFVKISAPYQNSKKAPLYDDMRVIAETLMLNGPDMVVFGSDWPHTSSKEGNKEAGGRLQPQNFRDINDTALIEEVKGWAVTEAQIQRLFVDNPRRLWDWEDLNS
ncbi:hypothetical protein BDV59DRAFT_201325 [Aspergillus ambiguus]|uniref:uncharacterized protein n=1 Tax=Aspergillus ambiguus TaxID=176160 RepID=UPI003CCCD9C5